MGYFEDDENERSLGQDLNDAKSTYDTIKKAKGAASKMKDVASKNAGKAVAKKVAKEGVKAAVGAATGGVGAAALEIADKVANKKTIIFLLVALLSLPIIGFIILITPILYVLNGATKLVNDFKGDIESIKRASYTTEVTSKQDFFDEIFEEYGLTEEILNEPFNIYSETNKMNVEISKRIIDQAVDYCFCADGGYLEDFLFSKNGFFNAIATINDLVFNYGSDSKTYRSYLESQYPYTLSLNNGTFYTIEDYMHTPKSNKDGEWDNCEWEHKIPLNEINNDLNYAEVLSVLSLSDRFGQKMFTLSSFYDFLLSDEFRRYFAEVDYSDIRYYLKGNDDISFISKKECEEYLLSKSGSVDILKDADKNDLEDALHSSLSKDIACYFNIEVYPYGLMQLYKLSGVNKYDVSVNLPPKKNYEMLDYYEHRTRNLLSSTPLGPSHEEERSKLSKIYSFTNTGRSLDTYVDTSLSLYQDLINLPEWDLENTVHRSIEYSPTGRSKILDFRDVSDDSLSYYVCQLDYGSYLRGNSSTDTIKRSGCCDSSYVMCAQYLSKQRISIVAASKIYVNGNQEFIAGGLFDHYDGRRLSNNGLLDSFGLYRVLNRGFNETDVVRSIEIGSPVVFHLYDDWGRHYKGDTHFIVIIGFDDNNFYVLDPANSDTYSIPIKDFAYAPIDFWSSVGTEATALSKTVTLTSSDVARFLINQDSNGNALSSSAEEMLEDIIHGRIEIPKNPNINSRLSGFLLEDNTDEE